MATFDTKRNLADQMEFNKQFFSPEAISARLEAKANIAANADVRKAEKMLPIQSKLYGQTELKKQELENRGYETAMNIKNVPDLEELKWKKSPKFFRQELSKVSMANAPEMEKAKIAREQWDFSKLQDEKIAAKTGGKDPFNKHAPDPGQEQGEVARPGSLSEQVTSPNRKYDPRSSTILDPGGLATSPPFYVGPEPAEKKKQKDFFFDPRFSS